MSQHRHVAPTLIVRPRGSARQPRRPVLAGLAVLVYAAGAVVAAVALGPIVGDQETAVGRPLTAPTGVEIVASPFVRVDDSTGEPYTCTTVSYRNGSSRTLRLDSGGWRLQMPGGEPVGSSYLPRTGDPHGSLLPPGATGSREVCFYGYTPGRNRVSLPGLPVLGLAMSWVGDLG
jgi:hypothetical protein